MMMGRTLLFSVFPLFDLIYGHSVFNSGQFNVLNDELIDSIDGVNKNRIAQFMTMYYIPSWHNVLAKRNCHEAMSSGADTIKYYQ